MAVKAIIAQTGAVASSWLARAEFSTVILRKRREGHASPDAHGFIIQQFGQDCRSGLLNLLPLTEAAMRRIETVCATAPASTFLRGADALHLACAAEHGFSEVYSNDRHFLAAAPLFGLRGLNVISELGL